MSVQTVTIQIDPVSATILQALNEKAESQGVALHAFFTGVFRRALD